MLTITPRPCQLGTSINTRTEMHGDESVPACDIPLVGITLDAEELGALLGDPTAHRALYRTERVAKDAKQQDLPINTFGDGEQPEQGEKRKRGRKPRNGATATH